MDGLLVIDKEANVTSRAIDNRLIAKLKVKTVGHLGTLDPFATGVLIVGVNEGTKIFAFMAGAHKVYCATLALGQQTDTGDLTGKVIAEKSLPSLTNLDLKRIAASFIGVQLQVPPPFSAKKVGGIRAYNAVRAGKPLLLKPHRIEVYALEIMNATEKQLEFVCEVSSGTYVRTLGEDIAKALNTVGHLTALQRIKVGTYTLKQAHKIIDVSAKDLIPLVDTLPELKRVVLNEKLTAAALNGRELVLAETDERLFVLGIDKKLLAIYGKTGEGLYECLRGFKH